MWKTKQSARSPSIKPLFFILSISKKKKKRGKKELNICPFRKQIYVTYSRKKKRGGVWGFYAFNTIQIPNTQYSDHEGLSNYPYIRETTLPVKTSPPCPLLKRRLTVPYLLGQRHQWNGVGTAG